ncbi:MAG: glycosyltransferase family 39 protein [bacterium]|nr:glycosyltransferase family 39 protein [bacterium]
MYVQKNVKITLLAIVVFAAILRFAALDRIPPGIYPDEAIKGIEGLEAVETGNFKLFYETNNGREGLWINLIGLAVRSFGTNQFSLRFWPALFGTLTVLGLFLLTRELFREKEHPDRIALLAAFFLATSFWHLNFSRIAFRAIMVPMLMVWSFYFLLLAWRRAHAWRSAIFAVIGGALFGLGFHTYIAFRFAPFVALVLFAIEYLRIRTARIGLRSFLTRTAWWLIAAFLTALPIGLYFLAHPQDFIGRAGGVSIFATDSPIRTFGKVLVQTLGMFNIRGDCNWRHNMACSPQLLFPVGIFFLIGLWILIKNIRQKIPASTASWLLIAWLGFLLGPELLTWEGIPHALRSIGIIPPVFMLTALGVNYLLEKFSNKKVVPVMVIVIVMVSGIIEPYRYFGVWAHHINTPYAFAKPYVEIVRYLNSLPPSATKYVIVNEGGTLVPHINPNGERKLIPMPAQTVMYLSLKQAPITYLLPKEIENYTFPVGSVIAPLKKDEKLFENLRKRGTEVSVLKFQYFEVGIVE